MKKVWQNHSGMLRRELQLEESEKLENAVYSVGMDKLERLFLKKESDNFSFDYKIYQLERGFIDRVKKTYNSTTNNLGILMNGVKGTGKTVSAKIICNELSQPTIIVPAPFPGVQKFLNDIPQNITIFIDEYEKIFGQSNEMLTIMDGAMNSRFRRIFIMTTNNLYIEDNLIQRPSRIRYLKKFDDLVPSTVNEIMDDLLQDKEKKQECMLFIQTLELITVDIVKAVIEEINIHGGETKDFEDVFNVKKKQGNYTITEILKDGTEKVQMKSAKIHPRPPYSQDYRTERVSINNAHIGRILEVVDEDTVVVGIYEDDRCQGYKEKVHLKVERAYTYHQNYAFYDDEIMEYGRKKRKDEPEITTSFQNRITIQPRQESPENNGEMQPEKSTLTAKYQNAKIFNSQG